MSKSVLLFSSGLDSLLADWQLTSQGIEFTRVYFDLDGIYNDNEIEFLKFMYDDNIDYHDALSINKFEDASTFHTRNRNALLATLAASIYDADVVYLNGVKDDRVSDNCIDFYEKLSSLLSFTAGKQIAVKSPLIKKEKCEWVRQFVEIDPKNNTQMLLDASYSCYNDDWKSESIDVFEKNSDAYDIKYRSHTINGCRACEACFRKFCALTQANIYVPFNSNRILDKYESMISKNVILNEYPNRCKSIKEYIDFYRRRDIV